MNKKKKFIGGLTYYKNYILLWYISADLLKYHFRMLTKQTPNGVKQIVFKNIFDFEKDDKKNCFWKHYLMIILQSNNVLESCSVYFN